MASFVKLNMRDAFENIQTFDQNVNNCKTSSTTNSESISLLDKLIKNFAKSYSKDSKPDETQEHKAKYIMNLIDQDKSGAVSLAELKNFDSSSVQSEIKANISDFVDNFKIYDVDGSGGLSIAEIKKAIGSGRYSMQELKAMDNQDKATNQENITIEDKSSSFYKTALDNYKKSIQIL